jgi:hypothetical protein
MALTGVVAVLAPAEDLQQRGAAARYLPRMTPHNAVAPGTFLQSPTAPRKDRWPFSEWSMPPDPVRMILY